MDTSWGTVEIQQRPQLLRNIIADVVVIGAGLAGLLTAYELQNRGMNVVVLEANRIMSGVSGHTTAKITAQHGLIYSRLYEKINDSAAKRYAMANLSAVEKFKQLIEKENIECAMEITPSYLYAINDERSLENEAEALRKIGVNTSIVSDTDLPFKIKAALKLDSQAQFNPVMFAKHIADKLRIYESSRVIQIEPNYAICKKGKVRADYIVMATNYPIINYPGMYFMRQHREQAHVEEVKNIPKLRGMYYGIDGGNSFRSFRDSVIVSGQSHRTGKKVLQNSEEFKQETGYDYPSGKVSHRWSAQDCMTHDGIPFIGRYSIHSPNLFVISGFNKWGMTSSMLASDIIADMIFDKANDFEKLFTPQRFHLTSTKSLFVDIGKSVVGLGSGVFTKKERKCTHLGCRLKENKADGTWDCPCHGSKFSKDGEVISGPAQVPLKIK